MTTLYKKRGERSSLDEMLAKVRGTTIKHKPIVHTSADINAAKAVLSRLLEVSNRNEVINIQVVPTELEED